VCRQRFSRIKRDGVGCGELEAFATFQVNSIIRKLDALSQVFAEIVVFQLFDVSRTGSAIQQTGRDDLNWIPNSHNWRGTHLVGRFSERYERIPVHDRMCEDCREVLWSKLSLCFWRKHQEHCCIRDILHLL
jgi:hypothetical protein